MYYRISMWQLTHSGSDVSSQEGGPYPSQRIELAGPLVGLRVSQEMTPFYQGLIIL